MLRPACLLSAERLSPVHGLLTPRSGQEVSLNDLGPATRRSDAYRDGTSTRWTCAACSSTPSPLRVQSSLCFVTHHTDILSKSGQPSKCGKWSQAAPPTGDGRGGSPLVLTKGKPGPKSAVPDLNKLALGSAIPISNISGIAVPVA